MKEKILLKLRHDLQSKSLNKLAHELAIPYATLWRMVFGDGASVSMRTWERVESFYKKRKAA